jgi:hypothetical protein
MITRRGVLGALLAAPAIIRTPGLLMPIRVLRGGGKFYWEISMLDFPLPDGFEWLETTSLESNDMIKIWTLPPRWNNT